MQGPNAHLIGVAGSRARLATPALCIDMDALARNIAEMAAFCRQAGVALRPHAKTHKSLAVARAQLEAGAIGLCCATLGEAEVMAGGGIDGVHITSPVVAAGKIERLAALNRRARGLSVVADHPENVDALAAAAGPALGVVVDLDLGHHRTGVVGAEAAVALARRIDAAPGLAYRGVQAYQGNLQHIADLGARRRQAAVGLERLAETLAALEAAGLAAPMVTGAGTGTHAVETAGGLFSEIQAGSYVFMDVDYHRVALRDQDAAPFAPALFVQTTVVSANVPPTNRVATATTDAGLKAFATDGPDPVILRGAPAGATYGFAGDEHGRVTVPAPDARPAVGDVLEVFTPHCDPTVNLYDRFHCLGGDRLVDIWPVDARGRT